MLNPQDATAQVGLGAVYRQLGQINDAEMHLAEAQRLAEIEDIYTCACIAAVCRQFDQALDLLQQSLKSGEETKEWVRHDPDFEELHGNPRFEALVG